MAAFITRLFMVAVFVGAMLPTAMASPKKPSAPKCKKGQFYFKEAKLCLAYGGPTDHAKPPKGKTCPAYGWAWSKHYSACVPKFPPTHVPQCPKHYEWCPPEWACVPVPTKTPPKTPPSKPSKAAPPPKGKGKPKSKPKGKRSEEIALPKMCPAGYDACPIPTAGGISDDFECVDTSNELESCGGCSSIGDGQDCTAIPGVWNVACVRGQCQVSSCAPGFTLSKADGRCVAN